MKDVMRRGGLTTRRKTVSADRAAALERLARRLDTTAGLVLMFSAAFLLRIAVAPTIGFYSDLHYFPLWAGDLAAVGPHRFYSTAGFLDYPPGYVYVLWLTAKLSATPGYLLLKLPAILGDLGLAWVAGTFASRLAPASLVRRLPVR